MSTSNSGLAGNVAGGEIMSIPVNLGSMFGIQQRLAALSRQVEQLASCFAEKEQRHAEEATKATTTRA